jgi:hypothetical protein
MRTTVRLCAWVAIVSAVLGQTPPSSTPPNFLGLVLPPATQIGNHKMGETFGAWLLINSGIPPVNITAETAAAAARLLTDICNPHGPQWKKAKNDCKTFLPVRDTGLGDIQIESSPGQTVTWGFRRGRVVEVMREDPIPNTQLEMAQLVEAYGPVAATKTVVYQNSYGAKWDCLEATWNMPDGTLIKLAESIKPGLDSGPFRWLTVVFYSKGLIPALTDSSKPNPYLPR